MTLSFHTKKISRADEQRLIGEGTQIARNEFVNPGITVPLKVTVTKINRGGFAGPKEELVYSHEMRTQGMTSFRPVEDRVVSRSVGAIALRPGRYRLEVDLLDDVGPLADVPARFSMGMSFKFKPNPDDCS